MKTVLNYISVALLLIVAISACKTSDPIAKKQAIDAMDKKVSEQRYTFTPRQALPMSGKSITLTSEYSVSVSPDTIKAHLPFFGRAYSAPYPASEGGIKFTSTDFEYTLSEKKKGVYRASVKINDDPNGYTLSILIGDNGSGTVYVNQRDKQSISFQGIIY